MRAWGSQRRLSLGLSLILGLASACASAPAQVSQVDMPPLMIQSPVDPLTQLSAYDAAQLFRMAGAEEKKGEFKRALLLHERLLSVFPEADERFEAMFAKGRLLAKLKAYEDALNAFEALVAAKPPAPLPKEAGFQVAFMNGKLKRWKAVVEAFWALRQNFELNPMETLEARVGQGVGLVMDQDDATAEVELSAALRDFEADPRLKSFPAEYWLGQARFYLGEIENHRFQAIELKAPTTADPDPWLQSMGASLEAKCESLLRAQGLYIQTMRVGHVGWASASAYRVGELYEVLHKAMLAIPDPPGLDAEASQIYRDGVKARVKVLVMKAIDVYETAIQMAERTGSDNAWIEESTRSLSRLRQLYEG